MTSHGLIALVTALPEEAEALLYRLVDARSASTAEEATSAAPALRTVSLGYLSGVPVAVAVTGDGERNARLGIRALLNGLGPARLAVLGTAGGLEPSLRSGDLIVAARVSREGARPLRPDGRLLRMVLEATGALEGTVLTVADLADTPAAKAELRRLSREPGSAELPAVVDLESAFYAAAAEQAGIPWVVVRAVGDTAAESLPSYLNGCRDTGGSVRRPVVLRRAARRPSTIPSLMRLQRQVRRGGDRLAEAAEQLVVAWADAAGLPSEAPAGAR
ncbi:MAG: hypothetical protein ACE5HP_02195 [Gemmatimonadota bacterium]